MRNTSYRCDTDDIAQSVDLDRPHMLDLGKTVKWRGHKKMEHLNWDFIRQVEDKNLFLPTGMEKYPVFSFK